MRRFLVSLLCCFCLGAGAFAQVRFEPGWIEDNSGIRKECLVRNTEAFFNVESIQYKLDENSEPVVASIADVSAFSTGGSIYERHAVDVDMSSDDINASYSPVAAPELLTRTVFLELLLDGDVRLYHHYTNYKHNYYISTPSYPEPTYLVFKNYITATNKLKQNTTFRGQLSVILQEWGVTPATVRDLVYDENTLVRFVQKYCGSDTALVMQRRSGKLFAEGGISFWPCAFSGVCYSNIQGGVEYVFPFIKNRASVVVSAGPTVATDFKEFFVGLPMLSFAGRYYPIQKEKYSVYGELSYNVLQPFFANLSIGAKFFKYVNVGLTYHFDTTLLIPSDPIVVNGMYFYTLDNMFSLYAGVSIPFGKL